MTLNFGRLLADVWALLRREGDLILRVAGPLIFLPAFAVQLLCDPLPAIPSAPRDEAAIAAWVDAVTLWGQSNAGWYLLADAIGILGVATLAVLLTTPGRPNVGEALGIAGRRYGRFLLAALLVAIPVGAGMWLFLLPGLYIQARLIAVAPVLAAEQPTAARASLVRSFRVTRGAGWAILGAIVTLFLLQWMVLAPLAPADAWLRSPGHENPFVLALVDAALAVAATAYHVGLALLGVVVWRRLARQGI
jgi:hypothetical protein